MSRKFFSVFLYRMVSILLVFQGFVFSAEVFGGWHIEKQWATGGSVRLEGGILNKNLAIISEKKQENVYDIGVMLTLDVSLTPGSRYLLELPLKSEDGPGEVMYFFDNTKSECRYFYRSPMLNPGMNRIKLIFDCRSPVDAGKGRLELHFGKQPQKLQLGTPVITKFVSSNKDIDVVAIEDQSAASLSTVPKVKPSPVGLLPRPDQWLKWGEPGVEWRVLDPFGVLKPCFSAEVKTAKSEGVIEVSLPFIKDLKVGERYLLDWPMRSSSKSGAIAMYLLRPGEPYTKYASREVGLTKSWKSFRCIIIPGETILAKNILLTLDIGRRLQEIELCMPTLEVVGATVSGDVIAIKPVD